MLISSGAARQLVFLLAGGFAGCGYVGLDELVDPETDGGPGAGGVQLGEGGAHPLGTGAGSGSGGDEQGLGGDPGSGAGDGSGGVDGTGGIDGSGGRDGSGGDGTGGASSDVPGYPCSTDCAEPFLLYRSFEIGIPVTPTITGGGTVDRTTEVVRHGMYSLEVTQGNAGSETELAEPINPVDSGEIFLRTWLYVPDGAITDWVKLFGIHGASDSNLDVNVRLGGAFDIYSYSGASLMTSDSGVLPTGEWFCLQVDTVVSDVAGKVSVRVNGAPVVSHTNIDTLPPQGISQVVYGMGATGSMQTGATIYWDDLVISTAPVSCE